MATRTISNAGGNYNSTSTWVEGVVPTSADDVVATATSGNLTINSTAAALTVDFTNYVGTLTLTSNTWTVSGTVFKLVAGMTITGTGATLTLSGSPTMTSAGQVWTGNLSYSTTATTKTLADNWFVDGTFTSVTATQTCNGNSLNLRGNMTITNSCSGTTNIIFNGTGAQTWSGNTTLNNNLEINKSAGTLTVSGSVTYGSGTLLYTAGTVDTTGSSLTLNGNSTLNTNGSTASSPSNTSSTGINWNNISIAGFTITNSSALCIIGTLTQSSSSSILNGSTVYLNGNFTQTTSTGIGSSLFQVNGSGAQTWTGTSSSQLRNNLTINKPSGTLTLSANVCYSTGTLTHTAGTVDTTTNSSTLNIATNCTLAVNGITWNNITETSTHTNTLTENLNIAGTWTISGNTTVNGNSVNLTGNLAPSNTLGGTTNLLINGTGSQSWSGSGSVNANLTINKASGTLTIGSVISYGINTFTYTTGTVDTTTNSSTITFSSTATLNIASITWYNVTIAAGAACTLSADLNLTETLSWGSGKVDGLFNINVGGDLTKTADQSSAGTSTIKLKGTGTSPTWSGNFSIRQPIVFDGNFTVSGSVKLEAGASITYVSGTITTTGSTLTLQAGTYTMNCNGDSSISATTVSATGINWNNLITTNITVLNNSSNFVIKGSATLGTSSQSTTFNGSNTYIAGDINIKEPISNSGTSIIVLNPTTTQIISSALASSSPTFGGAVQINGTGTITFTQGAFAWTFINAITYIAGSFAPGTLFPFSGSSSLSITNTLTTNAGIRFSNNTFVISGAAGFNIASFTSTSGSGATITLAASKTYIINTAITIVAASTNHSLIQSSTPGTKAIFTLTPGCVQELAYCNGTDMDSSNGDTVLSYNGILTNTINWELLTPPTEMSRCYAY